MTIQFNPAQVGKWVGELEIFRSPEQGVSEVQGTSGVQAANLTELRELGSSQCSKITSSALSAPRSFTADQLKSALEKAGSFNFVEVMSALVAAMKMLREAHREARHADRDAAVAMSMNAAQQIRDSALFSAIGAGILAGINIGVGISGAVSSSKQISQMASAQKQAQPSINAMNTAKAEMTLNKSQMQLKTAKADAQVTPEKIQSMEADVKAKAAKFEKVHEIELSRIETKVESKAAEVKKIENKMNNAKTEEAKAKHGEDLKIAKDEMGKLNSELDSLKARQERYADPLSPENLNSAEARLAENTQRTGSEGDIGLKYAQEQTALNEAVSMTQAQGSKVQSLNTIAGSLGPLGQSILETISQYGKAREHEFNAEAQKMSSQESEDADFQKNANDTVQSIMNTIKEYYQAQTQSEAAIVRNM